MPLPRPTSTPRAVRREHGGDKAMTGILADIEKLPADVRQEVEDFALFLMSRRAKRTERHLRQDWAGALREFRDKFTSVELAHKASEWRGP